MRIGIEEKDLPLTLAPPSEKRRRIQKFSQYAFFAAAFLSFLAFFSSFKEATHINYFFLVISILFLCLGLSVKLFKNNKTIKIVIGTLGIVIGIIMVFYIILYV